MLGFIGGLAKTAFGAVGGAVGIIEGVAHSIGLKPIRYFIDSHFRDHAIPVPGSVVYSDLMVGVEHSGIYVDDGQISNIVVTAFAEGQVRYSDAQDFTSKSVMGKKIYVSCRGKDAVGHPNVASGAHSHIGEQSFYGLVVNNCHDFSSKCVSYAGREPGMFEKLVNFGHSLLDLNWEPTLRALKSNARNQLRANKWRLWDWDNTAQDEPEPDWEAQNNYFKQQPMTPEFIQQLKQQLEETREYQQEISDENLPSHILEKLEGFAATLRAVSDTYDKHKDFITRYPGSCLSYHDIQSCGVDFTEMAKVLQQNTVIQELTKKMGRAYLSEDVKKQRRIPQADRSEVHGVHRTDDLMRLLPSELANLESEELELLFYSRLLEHNLLTYELNGITLVNEEYYDARQQRTGPVVASVDTSGSMEGAPLLKAKALLFAIGNILKSENRSLHVLLFGSTGQLKEYVMDRPDQLGGLMTFLQQGFGGGTDFETPLQRSLDIIREEKNYLKADILMLSDGDCSLSSDFAKKFAAQKQQLDCRAYSVLCNGSRAQDNFSDEVVSI